MRRFGPFTMSKIGLQIRCGVARAALGGFDSHTFPPPCSTRSRLGLSLRGQEDLWSRGWSTRTPKHSGVQHRGVVADDRGLAKGLGSRLGRERLDVHLLWNAAAFVPCGTDRGSKGRFGPW